MIDFVNYHLHSNYSLLDGLSKVTSIVDKSMELNQKASCITDHGNMYSIVRHFQYAQKVGQKAIAGFEAYIVPDRLQKGAEGESEANTSRNHMVLLAKNQEGYKKLCRICSEGFTSGMYYRPRIDNNVLNMFLDNKNENDIIATSACLAGSIPQAILKGDYDEADRQIQYYNKLFNGNFYLELQPVEVYEQYIINKFLIEYAKLHNMPLSMATDAHYLTKEDKKTHDVLLCMQSQNVMSNNDRWTFQGNTYYMMTAEELLTFFDKSYRYKKLRMINTKRNATEQYRYKYVYDYEGVKYEDPASVYHDFDRVEEEGGWDNKTLDKEALITSCSNTGVIADQCNVSFSFDKHYLPKINIPTDDKLFNQWKQQQEEHGVTQKPNEAYLKYLCIQGLKERFKNKDITEEYKNTLSERLKYELSVINNMDFPDYFLIYYDIVNFCRKSNIPVGPGRGCFAPNNEVLLEGGNKKLICDIKLGDKVIGHDELPHEVIEQFAYSVEEELLTLTTEGNQIINNVTKDHKIFAIKKADYDKGIRAPRWIKAQDLTEEDYICTV